MKKSLLSITLASLLYAGFDMNTMNITSSPVTPNQPTHNVHIIFNWNAPTATNGSTLQGYYYKIDTNQSTLVDATDDILPASATSLDIQEVNNSGDGDYYFHIAAYDTQGNISATKTYGPIVIDTTPPTLAFSPDASTFTSVQHIAITATDRHNTTIYYTLGENNSTYLIYQSPITLSKTTTIKAYATDEADNNSTLYTKRYTINISYPAIIDGVQNNAYIHTQTLNSDTQPTTQLTIRAGNSNITQYKYSINLGSLKDPRSITTPIDLTDTSDFRNEGRYRLSIYGCDTNNNCASTPSDTIIFTIDNTPPQDVSINISDGATITSNTTITFSGGNDTNFEAFHYTLDGSDPICSSTSGSSLSITSALNGDKTLKLIACDKAKNKSAILTRTLHINISSNSGYSGGYSGGSGGTTSQTDTEVSVDSTLSTHTEYENGEPVTVIEMPGSTQVKQKSKNDTIELTMENDTNSVEIQLDKTVPVEIKPDGIHIEHQNATITVDPQSQTTIQTSANGRIDAKNSDNIIVEADRIVLQSTLKNEAADVTLSNETIKITIERPHKSIILPPLPPQANIHIDEDRLVISTPVQDRMQLRRLPLYKSAHPTILKRSDEANISILHRSGLDVSFLKVEVGEVLVDGTLLRSNEQIRFLPAIEKNASLTLTRGVHLIAAPIARTLQLPDSLKAYSYNDGEWSETNTLALTKGYAIKVNKEYNLTFSGQAQVDDIDRLCDLIRPTLQDGWNLVGISVDTTTQKLQECLDGVAVFGLIDGEYQQNVALRAGSGAWVYKDGVHPRSATLHLSRGWNLITTPTGGTLDASILGARKVLEYSDGEYIEADFIKPNRGYWVYVDEAKDIGLSTPPRYYNLTSQLDSTIIDKTKPNFVGFSFDSNASYLKEALGVEQLYFYKDGAWHSDGAIPAGTAIVVK